MKTHICNYFKFEKNLFKIVICLNEMSLLCRKWYENASANTKTWLLLWLLCDKNAKLLTVFAIFPAAMFINIFSLGIKMVG